MEIITKTAEPTTTYNRFNIITQETNNYAGSNNKIGNSKYETKTNRNNDNNMGSHHI